MDSRSMDGKGDWGGDQNPSEEAWPKYCTHNVYQHTDSQGDVSYQTEPKQREAELPSMGKVLLCTSPTAWPLYASLRFSMANPRVSSITGGLAITLVMVRPAIKC